MFHFPTKRRQCIGALLTVLTAQTAHADQDPTVFLWRDGASQVCARAAKKVECNVFKCGGSDSTSYYFPAQERVLEAKKSNQAAIYGCRLSIDEVPKSPTRNVVCGDSQPIQEVADADLTQQTYGVSKMFADAEACDLTNLSALRYWGLDQLIDRKPDIARAFESNGQCTDPALVLSDRRANSDRAKAEQQGVATALSDMRGALNAESDKMECFSKKPAAEKLEQASSDFLFSLIRQMNGAKEVPKERLEYLNRQVTNWLQKLAYNILEPKCAQKPTSDLNAAFIKRLVAARRLLKEKLGYTAKACRFSVVDMTAEDTKPEKNKKSGPPQFAKELRAAAVKDVPSHKIIEATSNAEAIAKLFIETEKCDYDRLRFYGHGSPGIFFINEQPLEVKALSMVRDVHYNARIGFHACNVGQGEDGKVLLDEVATMVLTRDKGYGTVEAPLDFVGHSSFLGFSFGTYVTYDGTNPVVGNVLAPDHLKWVSVEKRGKKVTTPSKTIDSTEDK